MTNEPNTAAHPPAIVDADQEMEDLVQKPIVPEGGWPIDHAEALQNIPVNWIHSNPNQIRSFFDPAKVTALAKSIEELGLLIPLLVYREDSVPPSFHLISGHLRFAAVLELGWTKVFVRVLNDESLGQCIALAENTARYKLDPIDMAAALKRLIETQRLSHSDAAKYLGMSRTAITRLLGVNRLTPSAAHAIKSLPVAPTPEVVIEIAAMKPELQSATIPLLATGKTTRDDIRRVRLANSTAVLETGATEAAEFEQHLKAARSHCMAGVEHLTAQSNVGQLEKLAGVANDIFKSLWAALDKVTTPTPLVALPEPVAIAGDEGCNAVL